MDVTQHRRRPDWPQEPPDAPPPGHRSRHARHDFARARRALVVSTLLSLLLWGLLALLWDTAVDDDAAAPAPGIQRATILALP